MTAVPSGTYRQLHHDYGGPDGTEVRLPKAHMYKFKTGHGTATLNYGGDVVFNPEREFRDDEIGEVKVRGFNPSSDRFSPSHLLLDCLGKNFAQMEMRTILARFS